MKLPDLEELIVMRSVAHGLTLHAHAAARALLLGSHRSAQRGRGLEFEEVRPYVAGDDPRNIDWRVTARRGRTHTKLFREERERPVWLLVDLHPALFFGSRRQLKSALAVRAAALLVWTAVSSGDRVGAVVGGALGVRTSPPRSREAGALAVLHTLIDMQPRSPGAPNLQSFNAALHALTAMVHPGSLILFISDFATANAETEALMSRLAAHNECAMFWLTDQLESQALPSGRFRAGLPDRLWAIDGASARARWLRVWQEREARVNALANRFARTLTRLDTHESVEESLRPLLQARRPAA